MFQTGICHKTVSLHFNYLGPSSSSLNIAVITSTRCVNDPETWGNSILSLGKCGPAVPQINSDRILQTEVCTKRKARPVAIQACGGTALQQVTLLSNLLYSTVIDQQRQITSRAERRTTKVTRLGLWHTTCPQDSTIFEARQHKDVKQTGNVSYIGLTSQSRPVRDDFELAVNCPQQCLYKDDHIGLQLWWQAEQYNQNLKTNKVPSWSHNILELL